MSGMQPTEPSNAEPTAARTRRAKSQSSQADERDLQRQRVAVVIPAKDEARRIAQTVRAAKAIPHVDLVLVVDDGSEDNTQDVARDAGAVVVRHSHNRGKAAAMETGLLLSRCVMHQGAYHAYSFSLMVTSQKQP